MSPPDVVALIERLELLKPKLSAGDQDAQKEALDLSRTLSGTLNEPANTAVELIFGASITHHKPRVLRLKMALRSLSSL
jgi:hypothetical protein